MSRNTDFNVISVVSVHQGVKSTCYLGALSKKYHSNKISITCKFYLIVSSLI